MTRVLVLDYPGRRPEAFIGDLDMPRLGVEAVDLMRSRPPEAVSARAYAQALFTRHAAARGPAAAALAYCSTAAIAQELAYIRVEAGAGPMPLIIFNGRPVIPDDLVECYDNARVLIGRHGDRDDSVIPVRTLIDDPHALTAMVHEDLLRRIRRALTREAPNVDIEETAAQAALIYVNRMNHLLAAYHNTSPAWGGDVVHIVSADHTWREDWPGAERTEVIEIPCDRFTLLSDPRTNTITGRILGELA